MAMWMHAILNLLFTLKEKIINTSVTENTLYGTAVVMPR